MTSMLARIYVKSIIQITYISMTSPLDFDRVGLSSTSIISILSISSIVSWVYCSNVYLLLFI